MRSVRILCVLLAVTLLLGVAFAGGIPAKAANAVTHYKAGDTTYAILNSYTSNNGNTAGGASYSSANQGGEQLAQDGFVKKSVTPYAAWVVEAPAAGWYTFDPDFNIGHFDATPKGVYNVVLSVNDSRYFVGPDIVSSVVGTVAVDKGTYAMDVYLEQGVNVVRWLPLSGPDHYYNRITVSDGSYNVWVDLHSMGIDSRLTVCKAAPVTSDTRQAHFINGLTPSDAGYLHQSGNKYKEARELMLGFDSLCQENLDKMPYFSYTVNAPADGYYDIDLEFTSAGIVHGNDGYFVVRVNGTNYRRWLSVNGSMCKQNVSVPLKKGENTVLVTGGIGMKAGTSNQRYEVYCDGYANITRFGKITFYGGVTLSAAPVDPKTIADAPLPSVKLDADTYGVSTVPATLSGLTDLPTTRQLWEGEWFDKAAVPAVTFTVNAAEAGVYTVRPVYTLTAADGADALNYAITGSANDKCYDKARFEPSQPMSRTAGYSELTLELEQGINVIRILPVTGDMAAKALTLDHILISGGAVTGVEPQELTLKSAQAQYRNLLAADGDVLSGNTGSVATYEAVNGSNLGQLGWFAYTVNVPAAGYYDLQTAVGGGTGNGSLVMIIDGKKQEITVAAGRELESNCVNLSTYLAAGEHTILVSGLLGQDAKLGGLTVSGGITKASEQKDPRMLGVQPAVKEGGLVPGSVYAESDYQLTGIPANTTGAEFKSNFLENETVQFLKADGSVLADNDVITAGCGVLYPNGSYYNVAQVLTEKSERSIGADQILAMCSPIGRLYKENDSVHVEFSMASITLTGQLEGDVTLTLDCVEKTGETHNFYVEVDGKLSYFEANEGRSVLKVAEDLTAGKHTVKIHKGTDPRKGIYYIHSVAYTGELEQARPSARRIEFLGDSITAGSGVFFADCGFGYTQSWFTYANMMADAFGADHYGVANGGWRFTSTYKSESGILSIYDTMSQHDTVTGDYDFSWEPQLIVINLGTNDSIAYRKDKVNFTEESFAQNIKIMLDQVREKNPNAQIVWIYGSMLTENEAWIKGPVEEYAKTDSKVHYVSVRGNTKGRGDHPDFDGHTKVAITLTEAISDIMGWDMPVGTHATGDCDAATCEYCIGNARTLPLHTYTDECDATCNFIHDDGKPCEHTRTAPHYSADCTKTTCDTCGKEKAAQETHSFVGNACVNCGTERAALGFSGASVTLRDDLSLNFKFDSEKLADNGYESLYAVFTIGSRTVTVRESVMTETGPAFVCAGIAPHRMGEKVKATLYAVVDGEEVSAQAEYSIVDYCMNMLEKCQGDDYAKLRRLLVDLLQYGAAAQNYMNHRTDNLVTAGLSAEVLAEGSTEPLRQLVDSQNVRYSTVASPQVTWKGAGLYLVESVQVRLKFQAQDTQGLTVNVRLADQTYTMDASEFVAAGDKDTWYVYFDQLNAAQMSEVFQVTCYRNGVAVSDTLQYSIESYVRSKLFSSDSRLAALVIALMRYGDSANAYVK